MTTELQIAQMYSVIQTGMALGMQTLDQALQELLNRGLVDRNEVLKKAGGKQAL